MKIVLLFPPFTYSNISGPYLSLPLISGYIKKNSNYDVIQEDINLAIISRMLKDKQLKKRYSELDVQNKKKYNLNLLRFKSFLMRNLIYYNVQEKYWKFLEGLLDFYFSDNTKNFSQKVKEYNWAISDSDLNNTILNKTVDVFTEFLGVEYLKKIIPDEKCIVGFSIAFFGQLLPALTLSRTIKNLFPDSIIVFGGNTNSLICDKIKSYPQLFDIVDYFVLGEGEETFLELAKRIENNKNVDNVNNIIYRDKENEIIYTELKQMNINNAAAPDFTILNNNRYFYNPFSNNLILPLRTSLGCYWNKCSFCTLSLTKYNQREMKLVIEDIKEIINKYNPKDIWFVDLSLSVARQKSIAEALLKNHIKINWRCFARFEEGYTKETCKLLAKSGCFVLSFGLESGNDRVNALMNKGFDLKLAEQVLKNLTDVGIRTSVATIIGFPTEKEAEAEDTFEFLKRNINNISFFRLMFLV